MVTVTSHAPLDGCGAAAPGTVRLDAIATVSPGHVYDQAEIARFVAGTELSRRPAFARMAGIFENAGIERRALARPLEWLLEPKGWPERSAAFLETADELLEAGNRAALDAAGLDARDIDAIVTINTTGVATPDLASRQMERIGFRRDVRRLPVFGLGCAGGVLGLARAAELARGIPGSRVLVQAVELCSLAFDSTSDDPASFVAAALFADGAASLVLSADRAGAVEIGTSHEHCWPASLDVMGWRTDANGLGVVFAQSIPDIVRRQFGPVLDDFLAGAGLSRDEVDAFICHPGGAKVVAALEDVVRRPLDDTRRSLAAHGNMSSVSVLFALADALRRGTTGRLVMSALGPGFCAGLLGLRAGPA